MSGKLGRPGFVSFLATQALGAFNDNTFRFLVLFWILGRADGAEEGQLKGLAQALFAVPFVLFAAWAGTLADRAGKSRVIVAAKVAEIAVMALGVAAFAHGSAAGLLAVLFVMSTQSAFFGPAKYGWVAETVDEARLARANGLVQMTTMVAIVAGQVVGGDLYAAYEDDLASAAVVCVGVAVLGTLASMFVTRVPARRPGAAFGGNPFADLAPTWRAVRADRRLLYTMLGIGHFFLLSALLQIDLAVYGTDALLLPEGLAARLVATAVIGIAAGSVLAGRLSEGRVELGLVPLGALAMSAGMLAIALHEPSPVVPDPEVARGLLADLSARGVWLPVALVFVTGVAGGFFVVPLYAQLQLLAPEDQKGRYLAFGNLVSFAGIGLASLFLWLPEELGLGIRAQFLLIAALSIAGTVVSLRLLPDAFVRFLAWMLAHTVYRIRVLHEDRLPARGGALLVANHVSWVDALILSVSARRRLHFLMHRSYYEWRPTHWLFRMMGCIPVASGDDPEVVDASLREAGRRVEQGRLVVVFAEGSVTRLGRMLPLRSGYRRILHGRTAPIVPVHLGGLWGSLFSHAGGRLLWKLPRALPYPVSVTYGAALPGDSSPEQVRAAIRALGAEAWGARPHAGERLDQALHRRRRRSLTARLHEPGRRSLSLARLSARAALLAPRLARALADAGSAAGPVAVPARPGVDAAALIVALARLGRPAVPLDPLRDAAALGERLRASGATALLAEDAGSTAAPPGVPVVSWRPLVEGVPRGRETLRVLGGLLLPAAWLAGRVSRPGADDARGDDDAPPPDGEPTPDDPASDGGDGPLAAAPPAPVVGAPGAVERAVRRPPAALVFPREGPPRVLTHDNVLSAVEGLEQVLELDRGEDGVLGVLPLSTAYGLVTAFWFPVLSGVHVAWPADPDDGEAVGRLVSARELSVLPATPRELSGPLLAARHGHLGSVRLVVCGEGRLDDAAARAFTERFGVAPTGALTSTACSGLVALNTPDVRTAGHYQRGTREGSLGHPLPRVLLEVVDDAGRLLPPDATGTLRIRGACLTGSVEDGRTRPPPPAVTLPDRGRLDPDGFLHLEAGGDDGDAVRGAAAHEHGAGGDGDGSAGA